MQAQINAVVAALENAPQIVLPLVREIPPENLKRRPRPEKWSAHEHAAHLAEVHWLFNERLDAMLREENPIVKSYFPAESEEKGGFLEVDLDEALEKFARERQELVARLKTLSPADWQRTGRHEEYSHYSIFIMFRHLATHDLFHAYRIEEILLKKDWN